MESLASIETVTPEFLGPIFSRVSATSLVERSFTPFKSTPSLSEIRKTTILSKIVAPKIQRTDASVLTLVNGGYWSNSAGDHGG